jgi:hypothetical protein
MVRRAADIVNISILAHYCVLVRMLVQLCRLITLAYTSVIDAYESSPHQDAAVLATQWPALNAILAVGASKL